MSPYRTLATLNVDTDSTSAPPQPKRQSVEDEGSSSTDEVETHSCLTASSSAATGRSTAPSSPPSIAPVSPPSTRPSLPPQSQPSTPRTPYTPQQDAPACRPLSDFARATPTPAYFPKASPPSWIPLPMLPTRFAAHYRERLDDSVSHAVVLLGAKEIAKLVTSPSQAQADWVASVVFRANLPLAVSPIELPASSKALMYYIPGSATPLWVITKVVVVPSSYATPRRQGWRVQSTPSTARSQMVITPSTPQNVNQLTEDTPTKSSATQAFSARFRRENQGLWLSPLRHSTTALEEPSPSASTSGAYPLRLQLATLGHEPFTSRSTPRNLARELKSSSFLGPTKLPRRALNFNQVSVHDKITQLVLSKLVPRLYTVGRNPGAWASYIREAQVNDARDLEEFHAEVERRYEREKVCYRKDAVRLTVARGTHQWEYVAPLADPASRCDKYSSLLKAFPEWVAGEEIWVDTERDHAGVGTRLCQVCSVFEKDRHLRASLRYQLHVEKHALEDVTKAETDIFELSDHLIQLKADLANHKCLRLLLDRLPEDATTLLEYRIFYGLGETTPTVPCLFWSCSAAFGTASAKLVRLRTGVDPVDGPVNAALLHRVLSATSRLRRELQVLGAFVGWLPLDDDCAPSQPPKKPPFNQSLCREPLTESVPTIPDWVDYQTTYRCLGPDAAFMYDRLEPGVVMFERRRDRSRPTTAPLKQTRGGVDSPPHILTGFKHLGGVYRITSIAGTKWRTFPSGTSALEARPLPPYPLQFVGTTMPLLAELRRKHGLAYSLNSSLFDLAVRARHW